MTGKRYFKRMWEEEYYIFDSQTISESDFEEKLEYQDYKAFEDSLTGDEVVKLLNVLNEKNDELQIEKNNIQKQHSYELTKKLEYKSELIDLKKENEELKQDIENLKITIDANKTLIDVCEKKFKEMGYIITVDDDTYVIE